MGDGEVAVTGVEVAGAVDAARRACASDLALTDPALENGDMVATIASRRDARRRRPRWPQTPWPTFCTRGSGIELADAVMLMSAVGQVRVSQMVDPLRTARFEMPKSAYEPTYGPLL